MSFLRSMKVGPRLAAGFAALLLVIVVILAVVLDGNRRTAAQFAQVADINLHKIQLLNTMQDSKSAMLMHYRLMLLKQDGQLAADFAHIKQLTERYDAAWTVFETLPRDGNGEAYVQRIQSARAATHAADRLLDAAMQAGHYDQGIEILLQQVRPNGAAWTEALAQYTQYQGQRTARSRELYRQIEQRTLLLILAFGAIGLLLGCLTAWSITGSLKAPLADVLALAENIAQGNLDTEVATDGQDELTQLGRSMQRMQQQVQAVIHAQGELAAAHAAGHINHRLQADGFPGAYGRMISESNALVDGHVRVQNRLIEVMTHYAAGDLSVDMDRLPGEMADITAAMDATKANLSAINAQIRDLAAAAAAGDFSQRGDENRFQHDFRAMVASLNQLMDSTDGNLEQVSSLLKGIAAGDLTVRMQGDYQGVFARMRDDANTTVANLAGIVARIQQASGQINTAAGEIASGNSDLSRRTEQQAANLEETAASMEELTSTVRQNAAHARQANQLAIGAGEVATAGGEVVGQVVATMEQIQDASRKIADIIAVIDGIAFQTNILALNAAVEAARAGEQGRGFAVVAGEVRALAQRSATAAKEIKVLIDNSVERVDAGSSLVRKAGDTMEEIVSSVRRVTDIMGEISAASQEQTAGIEQVSHTVMQMDEATQQNAALVEEASAAARSMEDQAAQLSQAVAVFQLAHHAAAARQD